MTETPKPKKDERAQKGASNVQPQRSQPIAASPRRHSLFLTILGLLLAAAGLITLIELFPRLSATAKSPTDLDDPLTSSKFTVSNDGYMRVTDVMSACFLWKADLGPRGKPNAHITSSLARVVQPPESLLKPTEGFTVPCTGSKLIGSPPPYLQPVISRVDMAIVVYYRAWPFTFYRDHRLFRFVASLGKDGEVSWEKQPSVDLEPDYNEFIREHGDTFPPQLSPVPFR
jgi:hypothetical protein